MVPCTQSDNFDNFPPLLSILMTEILVPLAILAAAPYRSPSAGPCHAFRIVSDAVDPLFQFAGQVFLSSGHSLAK